MKRAVIDSAFKRTHRGGSSADRPARWLRFVGRLMHDVSSCGDLGAAYVETQNSIMSTLTRDHLPVRSVICSPPVGDLAWTDPSAHLHFRDLI